jgi:putative PIN family toxin of toxin-antitoxin system
VRVALDTNVLVSAVATRGLCADVFNVVLAEHELIVGETVLMELARVLRGKMGTPSKAVEEFESLLRREGTVVARGKLLDLYLSDRSDLPVLSQAVTGHAEVFVTGDRGLLEVATIPAMETIAPREFWERLRQDSVTR